MLLKHLIWLLLVGYVVAESQNATAEPGSKRDGKFIFGYLSKWLGLSSRTEVQCQGANCGGVKVVPVVYLPSKQCDATHPCASGHCVAGRCVACSQDAHCGAGLICSAGQCAACARDDQCAGASVCEHYRCVQCRSSSDCPQGNKCWNNVCSPDTSGQCQEDADCADGKVCRQGACEWATGGGKECSAHRPCPHGRQCVSGRCQDAGGPDDACWLDTQCKSHVCTPSGHCAECADDSGCARDAFCRNYRCEKRLPTLGKCDGHSQCLSNMCSHGLCVSCQSSQDCPEQHYCNVFKCQPLGLYSEGCRADAHCLSGKCSKLNTCVLCKDEHDCQSGEFCSWSGMCKPRGAVHDACTANKECLSGLCGHRGYCVQCHTSTDCGEGERCDAGVCRQRLVLGGSCDRDSDCASDMCRAGACVQCDTQQDCGADQYCAQGRCLAREPVGGQCDSDAQCDSAHCDYNLRQCVQCTRDEHCTPAAAGYYSAKSAEGGGFCIDNKCMSSIPAGHCCQTDEQCASGTVCVTSGHSAASAACVAQWRRGVCAPPPPEPLPDNACCASDSECQSGCCATDNHGDRDGSRSALRRLTSFRGFGPIQVRNNNCDHPGTRGRCQPAEKCTPPPPPTPPTPLPEDACCSSNDECQSGCCFENRDGGHTPGSRSVRRRLTSFGFQIRSGDCEDTAARGRCKPANKCEAPPSPGQLPNGDCCSKHDECDSGCCDQDREDDGSSNSFRRRLTSFGFHIRSGDCNDGDATGRCRNANNCRNAG